MQTLLFPETAGGGGGWTVNMTTSGPCLNLWFVPSCRGPPRELGRPRGVCNVEQITESSPVCTDTPAHTTRHAVVHMLACKCSDRIACPVKQEAKQVVWSWMLAQLQPFICTGEQGELI